MKNQLYFRACRENKKDVFNEGHGELLIIELPSGTPFEVAIELFKDERGKNNGLSRTRQPE